MDLNELITESTNADGSLNYGLVKQKLSLINESLSKNETSLENFIVGLGTSLTSVKLDERTKGVEILAAFIELLTPGSLGELETEYLIEYLVTRLSDHHSFIPIIVKALLHFSRFFPLSDKQSINIFLTIHREVANQQLHIQERFLIYQLIGSLFVAHLEAFKSIANDFLYGFIQIMEGERDPRCLLLCFELFAQIVSNLPLGHLDEELFDIVSCYFPIVYHPTRDKGIQITRDDLHEALKKCFMASPSFAPFAFLLFTEKLESEVESAKRDAYDMITSCTPIYGAKAISSFLPAIWTSIRLDVLRMNVGKLSEAATKTMAAILTTIQSSPDLADKFVKEILDDMEGALTKLSLGLFKTSCQFLALISACSEYYMKVIGDHVFPIFMKSVIFDQSNITKDYLEGFSCFFRSWSKVSSNTFFSRIPDQEILLTQLLSLFDSDDNQMKLAAVDCLYNLVQCSFVWDYHEEQSLARGLFFLVLSDASADDRLRSKARDLLTQFSLKHSEICQSEITQNLFDKLPDSSDLSNDDLERLFKVSGALKCIHGSQSNDNNHKLAKLTVQLFFQTRTNSELFSKVKKTVTEFVCRSISSSNLEIYSQALLSPLLKSDSKSPQVEIDGHLNEMIRKILNLTSSSSKVCILENFLNSLRTIQPNQSASPPSSSSFLPPPPVNLIKRIECILCNLTIDFQFSWTDLIQSILMHIYSADYNQLLASISIIIEVILNKSSDQGLLNITNFVNTKLSQMLTNPETLIPSIQIMIACNRGLVIRGGQYSSFFTSQLLNLMQTNDSESTVSMIAKYFVPCHTDHQYYEQSNGFIISPFYQQKYFHETSQILLKGYNELTGWKKRCYALCLLNHLKNLPKTVIRDEIGKFQSLTLFNLEDTNAPDNQITALDCLVQLIETHSIILVRNISGIINRLLELTKSSPYLEIRRKSLDCLSTIAKTINEMTLLPYRPMVLHDLKSVLDDRKRIVRYACTVAKHHWILIGQPA